MPLVHHLAKKFPGHDREEIMSAGFEGLVRAANRYNWKNKFMTIAYKYVKASMIQEIRTHLGRKGQKNITAVQIETVGDSVLSDLPRFFVEDIVL